MNKHTISYYIRIQNIIRLITPLAIAIMVLFVVKQTHLTNFLFTTTVDDYTTLDKECILEQPLINTTLYDLTYTGFNKVSNKKISGGYYYFFKDNLCYFVVLAPRSGEESFPAHIDNITIDGKLENYSSQSQHLINHLAQKLQWTESDLHSITSGIFLDETNFHPRLSSLILILLTTLLAICLANVLMLIIGIIFPAFALATIHHNNYFILPKSLKKAEEEYANNIIYSGDNMYITENFFINADIFQVCIIPLDQIVWAYYHSVLHRNIFFKHSLTYNLRLVTNKKVVFSIPNKNKNQCNEVFDIISSMYPEILIGYSDENHLDFLYQIKSFFKKSTDSDF